MSHTVLSRFWAHAPLSEHAPLLEYRRAEVNHNIYNIGAPACSITVVSRCYNTAGIRKKYHLIQTIEISSINF